VQNQAADWARLAQQEQAQRRAAGEWLARQFQGAEMSAELAKQLTVLALSNYTKAEDGQSYMFLKRQERHISAHTLV
jgi:hypothetical protein